MPRLFDIDGENLDPGFVNLRAAISPFEQELQARIEAMWTVYEPYADPDFRLGFARDVDGRFWEMYLGQALLASGKILLPTAERQRDGGQPDLCVIDEGRRVWIEAIAPDEGQGPDRLIRPIPINEGGGLAAVPVREAQLRTTSALWTKTQKLSRYLAQGVIAPDEPRIIAISASRFGVYVPERPLPMIMNCVFPIGDAFVSVDQAGEVVGEGFHASIAIARQNGVVPRTAFLDPTFAHVSGVLWSRVGIGNLDRTTRPLTFVHNPTAGVSLPARWGAWDREFFTTREGDQWQAEDLLAEPEGLAP